MDAECEFEQGTLPNALHNTECLVRCNTHIFVYDIYNIYVYVCIYMHIHVHFVPHPKICLLTLERERDKQ